MRGELVISKKKFSENNNDYVCSRNMVCGLLNNKIFNEQLHILDFVVFECISPNLLPCDQGHFVKSKGLNFVKSINIDYETLLKYENDNYYYILNLLNKFREQSDYDIDGIIITHNKIYNREKNNPKHSIAFKNNNYGKITTIKDIKWSISKYGIIIPRIQFEKVSKRYRMGLGSRGLRNHTKYRKSIGKVSKKYRMVLSVSGCLGQGSAHRRPAARSLKDSLQEFPNTCKYRKSIEKVSKEY